MFTILIFHALFLLHEIVIVPHKSVLIQDINRIMQDWLVCSTE